MHWLVPKGKNSEPPMWSGLNHAAKVLLKTPHHVKETQEAAFLLELQG